jgi:hypothetical protein
VKEADMKVHRILATMAVLSMGARMVVACSSTFEVPEPVPLKDGGAITTGDTCSTNSDCYGGSDCVTNTCDLGKCVVHNLALGSVPPNPYITADVCQRVVCDGKGNETVEPDPSMVPQSNGLYCQKAVCNDAGTASYVPDPKNVQPGPGPACQKYSCDDAGSGTIVPDPSNVPTGTALACTKPACDDAGNASTVADPSNPPPPDPCNTYACNGETPVATPANIGVVCSSLGLACDNAGNCDVCPAVNAQCTDPGPGAAAHTIGTAYTFGTIGLCDGDGSILCGALTGSEQSWFSYTSSGSFSTCDFDPYVSVQSTGMVKLCEYFQSTTLTCPAGSTNATDPDGDPGCCITTLNGSMAISPADDDTEVLIQIENLTNACVGYMASFHS